MQRGLLSCGMQTPICVMHVGSSSLTRDRTQAPCIGSMESYPLSHQGSSSQASFDGKRTKPCSTSLRQKGGFSLRRWEHSTRDLKEHGSCRAQEPRPRIQFIPPSGTKPLGTETAILPVSASVCQSVCLSGPHLCCPLHIFFTLLSVDWLLLPRYTPQLPGLPGHPTKFFQCKFQISRVGNLVG